MFETAIALDRKLFLFINNGLENRVNDLFLGGVTIFGNFYILMPVVALYLYQLNKKKFFSNVAILLAIAFSSYAIVTVLKFLIARPRPMNDLEPLIASGKVHVHNIVHFYKKNSFPSGHAQLAFATATTLTSIHRKGAFFFLLIAFLIALSRIYIGVHYPLDVLCGGLIGWSAAFFITKACKKQLEME